ncbi:uncharacterized protein LOC135485145 [Lineus longissimus]|uniref:uncharacterized protein LOC135485145 n=1 Tax=Lineus longissimus TaxID=88925 RepID=UPI002B4D4930
MVCHLKLNQLESLVALLKQYQPQSLPILFRIQKTLESVVSYDVFVDSWPDVTHVLTRRKKGTESLASTFTQFFALKQNSIILESILSDQTLFDFTKQHWIAGLDYTYQSTLKKFEEEHGLQRKDSVNYILYAATEETLPEAPLKGEVISGPIKKPFHIDEIEKAWTRDITREHIEFCLERFPSLCLTSVKTGELVAYGFIQDYGAVGKLFVKPAFRGQGYAKWIMTQLARRQIKDTGLEYHMSFVLETNVESSLVHQKCGYREYPSDKYFWVMFNALTRN